MSRHDEEETPLLQRSESNERSRYDGGLENGNQREFEVLNM